MLPNANLDPIAALSPNNHNQSFIHTNLYIYSDSFFSLTPDFMIAWEILVLRAQKGPQMRVQNGSALFTIRFYCILKFRQENIHQGALFYRGRFKLIYRNSIISQHPLLGLTGLLPLSQSSRHWKYANYKGLINDIQLFMWFSVALSLHSVQSHSILLLKSTFYFFISLLTKSFVSSLLKDCVLNAKFLPETIFSTFVLNEAIQIKQS